MPSDLQAALDYDSMPDNFVRCTLCPHDCKIASGHLRVCKTNLERAGFHDVRVVLGNGGLGSPEHAPYDRICMAAACGEAHLPLLEKLKVGGKQIAPIEE